MGRKNRLHLGMPRKQKNASKETLPSGNEANASIQQLVWHLRSMDSVQQASIYHQRLGRLAKSLRRRKFDARTTNRRKAQGLCKCTEKDVFGKAKNLQQEKSKILEEHVNRDINSKTLTLETTKLIN